MKTEPTNDFPNLPLHRAAYFGDLSKIKKTPSELNTVDERGLTALHVSILSQNLDCAAYLIEHGADLNMQTSEVLSSCDMHDRDRVKSVFYKNNAKEWNLEIPFDKKVSALHIAAALGLTGIVSLLCENKAKPNLRSHGGISPLHYASLFGHKTVVDTLLKFKAKITYKTKTQSVSGWYDAGMTALHAAAQSGNCQIIKSLIGMGGKADEFTKGGCGVIFFSARSKNSASVKLFLDAGALPETPSPRYFNDALNETILRSNLESAALIIKSSKHLDGISTTEGNRIVFLWHPPIRAAIGYQNQKMIKLLFDSGAKKPIYDDIDDAKWWGDLAEVIRRYDAGERPKAVAKFGMSHLYEAVDHGHLELVNFLLEHGYGKRISEQELESRDKNTPLHIAVLGTRGTVHPIAARRHRNRSYKIAELLLKEGADPNAVNYFGNPALHFPILNGDQKMVDLLLAYGADLRLLKK